MSTSDDYVRIHVSYGHGWGKLAMLEALAAADPAFVAGLPEVDGFGWGDAMRWTPPVRVLTEAEVIAGEC